MMRLAERCLRQIHALQSKPHFIMATRCKKRVLVPFLDILCVVDAPVLQN